MPDKLLLLALVTEGSFALIAIVWGWYREIPLLIDLDERSLLIGVFATVVPLAINSLLFGYLADRSDLFRQFAEFRERVAKPLVIGLQGRHTFLISALAGLGEELLFRGILSMEIGIHLSVLLFAVLHFGFELRRFALVFIIYMLFGYFFAGLVQITGSLTAAIICHSVYDYLAIKWLLNRVNIARN